MEKPNLNEVKLNNIFFMKDIVLAKKQIQSIVNIFETGKAEGDYTSASVLQDGAGITYGRSQSTDKSDSLDQIIFSYIDNKGQYAKALEPYISYLVENETTTLNPKTLPDWCKEFLLLLKQAGSDPIMQAVQDKIFDTNYWVPAVKMCQEMQLKYPLSAAIVYDTCIHSGPNGVYNIRKRFPESPPVNKGDEQQWATAYINARRKWLQNFANPLVQKTVYRMDALQSLINQNNWTLKTPFVVRGITIND